MTAFEPIAIIGQACLLPGANDPATLWEALVAGRDLVGTAPPERWGTRPAEMMVAPTDVVSIDRTWSDRGGYVQGFDALFDAEGFEVPAEAIEGLDPLFLWLLHTGREALRSARVLDPSVAGAVIGNLSFPSKSMARFAERVWLGDALADGADLPLVDPRNRFMSGLPAHWLARALGLGDVSFCLDAACASSLVAIKLACDRLHDRCADIMLAGAVSRADDLFIHVGFCALQAMSRSGKSRPFHPDADGLVPAEGAGMLVLQRLDDAIADGRDILGVIRAVGLSNDGRGSGLLVPSEEGQVRAMRGAYEAAGLTPDEVDYVECHATGTPTGDSTEVASMHRVFGRRSPLPIGSLKSNLGHLITTAGVAGVMKVLAAMKAETLPPTLHLTEGAFDALGATSFEVVTASMPWPRTERPRRAAVNAFGFGGNNAHLIVEEWQGQPIAHVGARPADEPVAVVAAAVRWLEDGETISMPLSGLRFPPKDLSQALPQQLLLMATAQRALAGLGDLPRERTGVLIGMGCDPNVARYGARWRLDSWARRWEVPELSWRAAARDSFVPGLEAAGVLGTMPNIVANRINSALDFGGMSMTVSAEQLSGLRGLEIAHRALRHGELDACVVGAVDLSREPVHVAALEGMGMQPDTADAAVVLVLERLDDAERLGHPVLALLDDSAAPLHQVALPSAHAAEALLLVEDAIRTGHRCRVEVTALEGQRGAITVAPRDWSPVAEPTDGPSLGFAAHWPTVLVPPLPQQPARAAVMPPQPAADVMHAMVRAPRLEPIIEPHREGPEQSGGPVAAPVPAEPRPLMTGLAPATVGGLRSVVSPVAHLSHMHQRFVAQQAALHEQFLALRQRGQAAVVEAFHRHQVDVPAPSVAGSALSARAPLSLEAPLVSEPVLPGPKLDRDGLLTHAGGRISDIFGPLFAEQDGYPRQVRMPLPPLLLADRMTGLDAEPATMGTGSIWTETDVTDTSWYLHRGRMPAGVMIESGQADLMLISYLGADLLNRSERVYRLLGCELTYHGSLPRPGDTLCYDIHVDGHAAQGDVRLFFFHYDCHVDGEPRLTVRGGQAGFFTDEELADSAGILWDAETGQRCDSPRLDPPPRVSERRAFGSERVRAFAEGRVRDCFGPGFEPACTHTDTPTIADGRMLFIDEVTHFEPDGGPWGRGYLRAVDTIEPDDWFFEGHFHNDPCMPGTLMFEGCMQTMAFYLAALGFTLSRDGWRFEPVPEQTYKMRCRGQVLPTSKSLVYEIFIEEVLDGPTPTIYADLLCTVDGLKAFHCRRMGLRLVPDWPLERILAERPELLSRAAGAVASVDGFAFDHASLLACAWGMPSKAFGPAYEVFDSQRTVARLPGPPYHFMTRVESIDGQLGSMQPGQTVEVAYDVPADAWYFDDNGARTMPLCVLLEAALQPCGWLASYVGSALSSDVDLAFRNLDGTGTLRAEVWPDAGTLRTRSTIKSISSSAGMIIESFDVECFVGDTLVYDMTTVFGFFPKEALDAQVGIAVPDDEVGVLDEPSAASVDLRQRPARLFEDSACLPGERLMMLERVTGIWPEAGAAGLGRYRAEAAVDPEAWFLRAHFFQDPVQPGSLGIEAMVQLLQFAMLDRGMADGLADPRFEPLGVGAPLTWKYRGQVRVHNQRVHTLLELTEVGHDERGRYAVAKAALYVDGMRIYEASNLAMRIVSAAASNEELLAPERDRWLADHCPTYALPALPMMSMLERLAAAAAQPGRKLVQLRDVQVSRWLPLPKPVRVKQQLAPIDADHCEVTLLAWREAPRAALSRFEQVASAQARIADVYPEPPVAFARLADGVVVSSPYQSLFHGPAFHKLRRLTMGRDGASALLDAAPGEVPLGLLNQVLLDAATHAIPHDELHRWSDEISRDQVGYPYRISTLTLHGETPTTGEVRCEVRFDGFDDHQGERRFPRFAVQLLVADEVWAAFHLIEVLLPKGPLGSRTPAERAAFLRDGRPVDGMALSRIDGGTTRLSAAEVKASNWLPGTLESVYDLPVADLVTGIARKEHVAAITGVHPSDVRLVDAGAVVATQPLSLYAQQIRYDGDDVVVGGDTTPALDLSLVRRYWDDHFSIGRWPVEDLYYGLIARFVRRVHLSDPAAFDALRGRSMLYLANHQTAIESLLFSIVVSGLSRVPTVTLAKAEHRTTWLGELIQHCFAYPGVEDPQVITYFDRADPTSLSEIIAQLAREMTGPGKSVMVHVEGTRALSCRQPVTKMTSAFIDMALATGTHIVPVRFCGGLPREPLETRVEFPVGMGKQDIYLGRPIAPSVFDKLPYKDRKPVVLDALNALGPANADEQPFAPDAAFAKRVADRVARTSASHEHATLFEVLADSSNPSEMVAALLSGDARGRLQVSNDASGAWLTELARRLYGPNR